MATIADITTVANATAAGHGYALAEYQVTSQGQLVTVSKLTKRVTPPNAAVSQEFGGYGSASTVTTARANALTSLNAARRHRYAGAPGQPSGATVSTNEHLDALTVDVN